MLFQRVSEFRDLLGKCSVRVRQGLFAVLACLSFDLAASGQGQGETLRLFWSTTGLVDPANNNGFTNFPALGTNPLVTDTSGPTRLYLWARFEGGGVQNWHIVTFDVELQGDASSMIVDSDFWSLTTAVAPRWAVHDDGVISGSTLNDVTLIALPPFSYGATNNATIMVHDPHWLVDTQVVLLGWVEFSGPGEVRISVGAGSIAQLDGESDLVRFGWDDDAVVGSMIGATSTLADATFMSCDTDSDSDGTPDCFDACELDPLKVEPGDCGCGVSDQDSDGDGVPDCVDGCPFDPLQTSPGPCGCGAFAIDSDNDGVPDCVDGCPFDASKSEPGVCGCGRVDRDSDGDGFPDCVDACPLDPLKTEPGLCGCGMTDSQLDSDNDGVIDCFDECPFDPLKTNPGYCGCGAPEDPLDSDGDGVPDCGDECPLDPNKVLVGDCGCRRADVDSDGDGVADCVDACPFDPNKTEPGACGCGRSEIDTNSNGIPDCREGTLDPLPAPSPTYCQPDESTRRLDADGDGVPDCVDDCPLDPTKSDPGQCGCDAPEVDLDGNRIVDCLDGGLDPNCIEPRRLCLAAPNSVGSAGLISVSGSFQISRADLKISALGLPPNSMSVLYVGRNSTQVPFGQGLLCVAGAMPGALPEFTGDSGIASFSSDDFAGQLVPGATRFFQVIYLDGSETNTTNAIQVTFCP